MRKLSILLMVFLIHTTLYSQEPKVLFLGNSYTYVNDLPQTIKDLAQSMGKTLYTDQNTPGGYRFLNHASNTTTYDKIFDQQWDYVVMQAQSQEPSWPPSQIETEVFPYAKQLSDSIKLNNPCSEVLFFSTWGRENGDDGNCAGWPPVCTFEGMTDRLTVGYYTMAEDNNASIAPVGQAWKAAREDGLFSSINLYSSDGSHPSVYGTYLTACVFYNSIFKDPVLDADYYSTITQDEALYLQSVANSIFSTDYEYLLEDTITAIDYTFNRSSWQQFGVSVLADFEYEVNNLEVSFNNLSFNGDVFSWSFGDGNSSGVENPINTYSSFSQYDVKLISDGQCGIDTTIKTLDLSTQINKVDLDLDIKIWTEDNEVFFDNIEEIYSISIYRLNGTPLVNAFVKNRKQLSISIDDKSKVLLIKLTHKEGNTFSRKIVL